MMLTPYLQVGKAATAGPPISRQAATAIAADILRLIAPPDRPGFQEMLRCELQQYREPLLGLCLSSGRTSRMNRV
jgi:hypothetical protein